MEPESTKDSPLGILLIATFWIFVGVLVLSMISSFGSQSMFMLIFITLGTFFIFIGWGLITLKAWAYYASLVIALLGLIPAVYAIPSVIYSLMRGYFYGMTTFIFLAFIPMAWYLFKNMNRLVKKQKDKTNIFCPQCGRPIPFDANFCPYCEKKI
ncbi:MAG: zinc ribbon domain-containing protein [Euryarchaeota archaeon]|nr:zinc ribbon domain-containing protein [Euryarchaeota archaeon]